MKGVGQMSDDWQIRYEGAESNYPPFPGQTYRRLVQDHGPVRIQGLFLLIFCNESTLFSVSVISYGN
jgi:hypothetical protein